MASPYQPSVAGDQIVISLRDAAEGLTVAHVDLTVNGLETRITGGGHRTVESVFRAAFAQHVRAICLAASTTRQVLYMPDYEVRLGGLELRGYTLRIDADGTSGRRLALRMRRLAGDAMAVFRSDSDTIAVPTARIAGGGDAERLFNEMLSQVYLPLADLNRYLDGIFGGNRTPEPEQLTASILRFKTKAEALQFAFERLIGDVTAKRDRLTRDRAAAPPPWQDGPAWPDRTDGTSPPD